MPVNFIGLEYVDYLSKNGKRIQGAKLYFTEIMPANKGRGERAFDAYVSADSSLYSSFSELPLGDVEVLYDRNGRICDVCSRNN